MIQQLLNQFNTKKTLKADSSLYPVMSQVVRETKRLLAEMNLTFLEEDEIRGYLEKITHTQVPDSLRVVTPFYTDFGRNMYFGENTYINRSCHFQDQGGITIGNNNLIGHQVVFATVDHDFDPDKRGDIHVAPILLGDNVWIGSNATILKGVTIGKGAIVAAGSVVKDDVKAYTLVGGNPAVEIRKLNE